AIPGHVPPPEVLSAPGLVSPSAKMPPGQGDHLAMQLAISAFQRMHQQVTLINLPEFDYPLGHVWGANRDPGGVKTLMQSFDRDLAALEDTYRQAGVLDRTLFVLTADHGFAPIYHTVRKRDVEKAVAT